MSRRVPLLFLCVAVLAGGGCQRADDGTVVIPRMLDGRRFFEPETPQVATRLQPSPGAFPVGPVETRAPRPERPRRATARTWQPAKVAEPSSMEPAKPLSCGNADMSGTRVRVVCR